MEELIITPKTKMSEIFKAYPQLEEVFLEMAPEYKKQKNPALRATIFKVTTVAQAAIVGGAKVEEMVTRLRKTIGQSHTEDIETDGNPINDQQPEWYHENLVTNTIDTREMLNRGEHPVHEVLEAVKKLPDEGILKVIVSFIPAPMIDKASSLNYQHWLVEQNDGLYWLYFRK